MESPPTLFQKQNVFFQRHSVHQLTTQTIKIGDRCIRIDLPANPDQVLDEAAQSDQKHDPYWSILWPAAIEMAECVLKSKWLPGQHALELGCGAGLVGVAGLLAGLNVTFSDLVQKAVKLAAHNAAQNGFPGSDSVVLDWSAPPEHRFDVILASDILYEVTLHAPLLAFLRQSIRAGGGRCYLGDPGRPNARHFRHLAEAQGWQIDMFDRQMTRCQDLADGTFRMLVLS